MEECTACVRVSTCQVLHAQLDKRCDERHKMIDADRAAFKSEIRELFVGRASERAWGLVGKIVIGLAATWAAVEKLLILLHEAPK